MSAYETVIVCEATQLRSTDKAALYRVETDDNTYAEVWIPFSQLRDGSVDKDGTSGDLHIPRWLAEDNELEYSEEDDD